MTREELAGFITENYCDIDKADSLPRVVGQAPSQERLVKRTKMVSILEKAKREFGEKFSEFLEVNFGKTSTVVGKRRYWFFWLQFENSEDIFKSWTRYLNQRAE